MKVSFSPKRLLIIPLLPVVSLFILQPTFAKTLLLDKYGNLSVINEQGSVLSIIAEKNDTESSGNHQDVKTSTDSKTESSQITTSNPTNSSPPSSSQTTQSIQNPQPTEHPTTSVKELESLTKEIEKKAEDAKKALENDSHMQENLNELHTEDVFKIHDDKQKSGVFKLESSNGKVKVESQMEGKESSESAEVEKVEVEESADFKKIKIKTSGSELEIESQGVKALTSLPVNLDTSTNSLSITTSKNKSLVKVLPAQVIQNLINQKIFDEILDVPNLPAPRISTSSATQNGSAKVDIEEKNGEAIYKIRGTKTYKFLNLVPVEFNIESEVSPETGAVKNITEPLVLQILGLLFSK